MGVAAVKVNVMLLIIPSPLFPGERTLYTGSRLLLIENFVSFYFLLSVSLKFVLDSFRFIVLIFMVCNLIC